MAKAGWTSVDDYLAAQPAEARALLKQVRNVIRRAVPHAEEVISYQIPAYKLEGKPVLYFAGWKQHYALYPASTALVSAFKDELAPYALSRGTIRFPLSKPVPARLIARLARFRAAEVAAQTTTKAGPKRKQAAPGPKPRKRRT